MLGRAGVGRSTLVSLLERSGCTNVPSPGRGRAGAARPGHRPRRRGSRVHRRPAHPDMRVLANAPRGSTVAVLAKADALGSWDDAVRAAATAAAETGVRVIPTSASAMRRAGDGRRGLCPGGAGPPGRETLDALAVAAARDVHGPTRGRDRGLSPVRSGGVRGGGRPQQCSAASVPGDRRRKNGRSVGPGRVGPSRGDAPTMNVVPGLTSRHSGSSSAGTPPASTGGGRAGAAPGRSTSRRCRASTRPVVRGRSGRARAGHRRPGDAAAVVFVLDACPCSVATSCPRSTSSARTSSAFCSRRRRTRPGRCASVTRRAAGALAAVRRRPDPERRRTATGRCGPRSMHPGCDRRTEPAPRRAVPRRGDVRMITTTAESVRADDIAR